MVDVHVYRHLERHRGQLEYRHQTVIRLGPSQRSWKGRPQPLALRMQTSLRLNWSQIPFKRICSRSTTRWAAAETLIPPLQPEFQTQWDAIVDKLSPLMVITNTGGAFGKLRHFKPELPLAILISPAQ